VVLQKGRPAGSGGEVQLHYAAVAVWVDDVIERLLVRYCWIIRGQHSGVEGEQRFSAISTYREGRATFLEFTLSTSRPSTHWRCGSSDGVGEPEMDLMSSILALQLRAPNQEPGYWLVRILDPNLDPIPDPIPADWDWDAPYGSLDQIERRVTGNASAGPPCATVVPTFEVPPVRF
jgi:hypothetical protein